MASLTSLFVINNVKSCMQRNILGATINKIILPCVGLFYQQVRTKKRNVAQYRRYKWYVRTKSSNQDDLNPENEQFVKHLIHDMYGEQSQVSLDPCEPNRDYTYNTRRCGVLALKLGVLPQWTKTGHKFFCTLLQLIDNNVIRYTSPEVFAKSSGYKPWWGLKYGVNVVGCMNCDPRTKTKEYTNLFEEASVPPKKRLTRFMVTPNAVLAPGTPLNVMHFRVGDYIDVHGKTIDYGFQGVVKRWGMKGMPASHGVTKAHRKMGATGGGGDKSGIWKGKHMPGHMGNKWSVLKGLKIWRISTKYNVLYVHSQAIAGAQHSIVRICDCTLPTRRYDVDDHPPFPTWYPSDSPDGVQEWYYDKDLHPMCEPSLNFSSS